MVFKSRNHSFMILFVGVGNLNTIKYSLEANVSPFKFESKY